MKFFPKPVSQIEFQIENHSLSLCSPCVQPYSRVGMREHSEREHRGGVQKVRALLPGEQEREHGGGVQKIRALLPGEQQLQG